MDIGFIIIIIFLFFIIIRSYTSRDELKNKNVTCFLDKLLFPFYSLYSLWKIDNCLNIDYIKNDKVILNTRYKTLYAIEVINFDTLDDSLIYFLFSKFKSSEDSFFYQVILKDNNSQRQYLFSYSKDLIDIISNKINSKILSGIEISKILKKIIFVDDNKNRIDFNTSINRELNNLKKRFEVYQGYKAKKGEVLDVYKKLKETDINCAIWGYYDFYEGRVNGYISSRLQDYDFYVGPRELVIINFILISENITSEDINKISSIYNISLVKKSINGSEIIAKTPLKHRDVDWDLLVDLDYLSSQFLAKDS